MGAHVSQKICRKLVSCWFPFRFCQKGPNPILRNPQLTPGLEGLPSAWSVLRFERFTAGPFGLDTCVYFFLSKSVGEVPRLLNCAHPSNVYSLALDSLTLTKAFERRDD